MAEDASRGLTGAIGVGTAALAVAGALYNGGFIAGLTGNLTRPTWLALLGPLDFMEGVAFAAPTILVMGLVVGVIGALIAGRLPARAGATEDARRGLVLRTAAIAMPILSVIVFSARGDMAAPAGLRGYFWVPDTLLSLITLTALGVYFDGMVGALDALAGRTEVLTRFIGYTAGLAFFVVLFGYFQCRAEMASTRYDAEIVLKAPDKGPPERLQALHIVRAFSGGVFYTAKADPGRIGYVRIEEVERLSFGE